MKKENTKIDILKKELEDIEVLQKSLEEMVSRKQASHNQLSTIKNSLAEIKKRDSSLDLEKATTSLEIDIKKKEKEIQAMERNGEITFLNKKWIELRIGIEDGQYKKIGEENLSNISSHLLMFRDEHKQLEKNTYRENQEIHELDFYPKPPGIVFKKRGYNYLKTWIFLLNEDQVEMFYSVTPEAGDSEEEHVFNPEAKELQDQSPSMTEVIKKIHEIFQ
ncbi:MAG: hypothetical protein WCJ39_02365 [bacterium]